MPAMSPSQLSALKTLDPLHQEEKGRENNDRQPDVEQVGHGASFGASVDCISKQL
jgi:hypothetical protein